jgi:hypothetical protein
MALNVNASVWSAQRNQEVGTHDDDLPDIFDPDGIHARILYDHGLVRGWVRPNGTTAGDNEWKPVIDCEIEPLHVNSSELLIGFTSATGAATCTMEVDNVEVRQIGGDPKFVRGDANSSGEVNLTDGIVVLNHLFRGFPIECKDAGDANDDGSLNLTDGVRIFVWLFRGGPDFPPPTPDLPSYSPSRCELDPTADGLDCAETVDTCSGP